jgi:hypothetical protein
MRAAALIFLLVIYFAALCISARCRLGQNRHGQIPDGNSFIHGASK